MMKWCAVLAGLIASVKGRVEEEIWFQTEPKQILLDQVIVNSAGSCTFYQDQVCSTFGEVERDTFGFFRRHPNETEEVLEYVVRFEKDEVFSFRNTMENGRFLVPVYLHDSLWLLRTVKDGENVERFHIFSTKLKRLLKRDETNLYELDGYDTWRSIAHADPAYYYLATDTGILLGYDESAAGPELIRFSQVADAAEPFQVNKFDWPLALDRMTGRLRVGVVAGKVYYSSKLQTETWERAAILPFTEGIGTCVGVRIVRCRTGTDDCGFVAANILSSEGELFTRYISYRGTFQGKPIPGSSPSPWKLHFVSFEDRVGVVYPEYARGKEVVFRVIPVAPISGGVANYYTATMVEERTYMEMRSFDLEMKVKLSPPQVQNLGLSRSELDSRAMYHVQCHSGECLAAYIGTFSRVNVFYTNQRNFDFKWVKIAQASSPGSLIGVQVSQESAGAWIVMVVSEGHVRFARVNPAQSTGMEWFEPFELPTSFQACGLYIGVMGGKSYVACSTSSEESGDTLGTVFFFKFTETGYNELGTETFRSGDSSFFFEGIPLKTLRIEWGNENTFTVVTSHASTIFVSNKPVYTFYPKDFAFSPSGNGVFYFQTFLTAYLIRGSLGDSFLRNVFWGWNSWEWNLHVQCKVSSVSSIAVLFVCTDRDHTGSLLFNSRDLTYRGIDYKPQDYDTCSVLSPSDGVLVEMCIDALANNVTSSVFKANLNQLDTIAVGADDVLVDVVESNNKWRMATIVVGSVLGLVLVVVGVTIFKKKEPLDEEDPQVRDGQLPFQAAEIRSDAGSVDDEFLYATPAH